MCFQRNQNEEVPGCQGEPSTEWDYCYDPRAEDNDEDTPTPPAPAPGANVVVEEGNTYVRAVFDTQFILGDIVIEQGEDTTAAKITLTIDEIIPWLCPNNADMMWSINAFPLGGSIGAGPLSAATFYAQEGPDLWCQTTGGHFDPTYGCGGLSEYQNTPGCPGVKVCDAVNDITSCEMGDLTGKHGYIKPEPAVLVFEDTFMTNINALSGRSIGFSCPQSRDPPMVACATLLTPPPYAGAPVPVLPSK